MTGGIARFSTWRLRCVAVAAALCALLLAALAGSAGSASAAVPAKTDVMFIFDTSGSMNGSLNEAKEEINALIAATKKNLPNVAFGVADVEDLPGYFSGQPYTPKSESEYKADPEKPWALWQPLTEEAKKVEEAVANLSGGVVAHNGGDLPEAYGRALFETATNSRIGWRTGARHEMVLIADNVPHTPNVNEAIPASLQFTAPFTDFTEGWPNTGEELGGVFGIEGTAWKGGESLEFHKILAKLDAEEKPLAMVNYFHTGESESENFIHYWEYWAAATGGQAIQANEGSKTLSSRLSEIIKESAEGIPPCAPGFERTATTPCVKKPPPPPPPHPTVTQVICNLVIATATDTCTATVGDASGSSPTNPTGAVSFTSSTGGTFIAGAACTLVPTPMSGNTSSCSVQFLPPTTASLLPGITAAYGGDAKHAASAGSTHYAPLSELAKSVSLSEIGTIHEGKVEIPASCAFACVLGGSLFTGPDLATLASSGIVTIELAETAATKHHKKPVHKPKLLGTGTLKLSKAGKGKLVITILHKYKQTLDKRKVTHLTLKLTEKTLGGALVANKTLHVTLKPKKKKH